MTHESHVSVKTGLPPGTPIYIGKQEPEKTHISVIVYNETDYHIYNNVRHEDLAQLLTEKGICWISITGLRDIEIIQQFLTDFSVHPLISEDIFNTKGRMKAEDIGDCLFITLDMIRLLDKDWSSQKVSIMAREKLLLSIIETGDPFQHIKTRISHPNGKFRSQGTDYLLYAIIDSIVDSYYYALERIEEAGEVLEGRVLDNPHPEIVRDIQIFRQNLIRFRRQAWSIREVIMHLERFDSLILSDSIQVYFRDVYDHVIKISEDLDVYREMAEGIMEIYLSSISNRTNEIVRVLTVIAVIFIPLTFITGVYGMNFAFLPGINHPLGHVTVFAVMIIIVIIMVGIFRFKKWI